ncbi:hypothetical protein OPIT5_28475 [Opitutaceae bacterium TAV5]|nr:hypothetical protein OPIT5_28475 [Opitutaceae bacterium TAV5]
MTQHAKTWHIDTQSSFEAEAFVRTLKLGMVATVDDDHLSFHHRWAIMHEIIVVR